MGDGPWGREGTALPGLCQKDLWVSLGAPPSPSPIPIQPLHGVCSSASVVTESFVVTSNASGTGRGVNLGESGKENALILGARDDGCHLSFPFLKL